MKLLVVLSTFAAVFSSVALAADKNIICYFTSWAVYRDGAGAFDVKDIDPFLCTHINFAFLGLFDDGSINVLDPWESSDPGGIGGFKHLVALKNVNPDLKILVSMGGWSEGTKNYSQVAASEEKRKNLANNVLKFIEQWNLDGFDLDWVYPAFRDGDAVADKENFVKLLNELSSVLKPKGYLLTIAVAADASTIDKAYDVDGINKVVDFINILTYNLHGSYDGFVNHNAPLYAADVDNDNYSNNTLTVDFAVNYWLGKGASPEKLNLGTATYGRTFTLTDENNTALYAPADGPGEAGPYTKEQGILGYNEICLLFNDTTYVWDDQQKVPHRFWGNQWVGYDNERSIGLKADLVVNYSLAGVIVWSLDTDDFRGTCGEKYPLMNALKNALNGEK